MDKNYYEILEVDRNASPEIIEKAYKTLAKKYHPDLHDATHKKEAEETFKMINEAYEILSNPDQRSLYDQRLEDTIISQDKYDEMYEQNQVLKNKLNDLQQHMYNEHSSYQNEKQFGGTHQNSAHNFNQFSQDEQYQRKLEYEQHIKQARNQAYHDAYIQDLKNRGYKIRYKKSFSDYVKSLIALAIVIFILFIVFQLPFVKNYFIELYNTNSVFRVIGNIFINIFT